MMLDPSQELTNSVPAVAVTQRVLMIFNWNRRKGCVGALLEFIGILGVSQKQYLIFESGIIKKLPELLKHGLRSLEFNRNTW